MNRNKLAATRTLEELFNRGDVSLVGDLIAEDAVDHNEPPGTDCRTHFAEVVRMLHTAFPDFHMTIEDMMAEGDKVALRLRMTGTHNGPFLGIPPTGRKMEAQQIRIVRFQDARMTDSWAVIDFAGIFRQLGAVPQPAAVR